MSWNPLDWLVTDSNGNTVSDLQNESDAADARLAELNRNTAARIAAEQGSERAQSWYRQAEANREAGRVDASRDVTDGFKEGWQEGQDRITETSRGLFNWTAGFIKDLLPGWLWIVLIVGGIGYALWQFGWLAKWLKAK